MKRLTQIFQALLGVAALMCAALIAAGRFAWNAMRNRWNLLSQLSHRL